MLATAVRRIIAPAVRLCPPQCGVVALTRVEVSPDGSFVTAYVSSLLEPVLALSSLEGRLPELQRALGSLRTRHIPRLRFRLDEREEQGNRVDEILRKET
jgi:ribosome-binding factor A